jgi:hypothetical protein
MQELLRRISAQNLLFNLVAISLPFHIRVFIYIYIYMYLQLVRYIHGRNTSANLRNREYSLIKLKDVCLVVYSDFRICDCDWIRKFAKFTIREIISLYSIRNKVLYKFKIAFTAIVNKRNIYLQHFIFTFMNSRYMYTVYQPALFIFIHILIQYSSVNCM